MLTLLDEVVPARAPWSHVLRAGECLEVTDIEGQQAVDALFYAWPGSFERYSAQDTMQAIGSPYIGRGAVLLSSEGRAMLTMIEDNCGNHDTSAGCCSVEMNVVRFGEETRFMHACRENFISELSRWGLSKRDIVLNLNLFMNVPIAADGELIVSEGISEPGHHVTLRAEMDVLCVLSNCPQLNNPCNAFRPTPIRVRVIVPDGTTT